MPINGTIVNYFIHCKRQCYMHYNRINMEDESELVKIGKAMHEEKKTDEITVENIKVDKIKKDYLIEIKKSDADIEAAKMQVLYYLLKLIIRKYVRFVKKKINLRKKAMRLNLLLKMRHISRI